MKKRVLDRAFVYSTFSHFSECGDEDIKAGEPLVRCKTFYKSRVNLLGDDSNFERAENVIVQDIRNVTTGVHSVHLDDVRA